MLVEPIEISEPPGIVMLWVLVHPVLPAGTVQLSAVGALPTRTVKVRVSASPVATVSVIARSLAVIVAFGVNELTLFSLALASSSPEGARNDGVAGTVKPRPRSAPNAGLPLVPLVPAVPLSPFGPCRPLGELPGLEVPGQQRPVLDVARRQRRVPDVGAGQRRVLDVLAGDPQRGVRRAAECDEQRDEAGDVRERHQGAKSGAHGFPFVGGWMRDRRSARTDPPSEAVRAQARAQAAAVARFAARPQSPMSGATTPATSSSWRGSSPSGHRYTRPQPARA